MQKLPKVLLVEDDRGIAAALSEALKGSHDIDIAPTGKSALYKADSDTYDLVILDLNLPDFPGITICQQLRERGYRAPILVISGEVRVMTKINLLDAGANDYLTKPFSLGELKARLRALQRTADQSAAPVPKLEVAGIHLDRQSKTVIREGMLVELRRKEFEILEYLMSHAGSVVSRESLKHQVWQNTSDLWTNTVDVHIKYLRDKLDKPFGVKLIKTVHGLGYKLDTAPVLPAATK